VVLTDLVHGRPDTEVPKGGVRTRVVLDTSVLIGDPGCLHSFAGVDVVIPFTVIEELDSLKTRPDDVGRAARTALRTIEEHRISAGGSLARPFAIGDPDAAGTLQVEINGVQKHLLVEHGLDPTVPDNRIIGAALGQAMHAPTRMVSNDAALRIKAAHLGLESVEHHPIGRSS
jgi:PhoH-like ATPase